MGNAQVTGNAGLYYCCYKLSLLGWNVMPTARNARGIDIIAYSPDAKSFCGIQVKTVSKRDAIPLGDSLERMMGDYWVVVSQMASGSPCAYVLTPDEVTALAHRNERDGKVSYWLERVGYENSMFLEAWGRLGQDAVIVPHVCDNVNRPVDGLE
ncbi:MAG: hypothetical protein NTV26_07950 [Caldiserica bacterium]|nr:hypothetical protein [Caldisericota bacterium]